MTTSDLPHLWAASDLDNRQQLARALFERIEVMGVEEVRIVPTREALDYGWFEAWAGKTLRVPLDAASMRYGRGERICASMSDGLQTVRFVRGSNALTRSQTA